MISSEKSNLRGVLVSFDAVFSIVIVVQTGEDCSWQHEVLYVFSLTGYALFRELLLCVFEGAHHSQLSFPHKRHHT
jgi:hypothetical protein